jgi:hypothetical protein
VEGGTVIAEDWNTQDVPLAAGVTDEWVTSTVVYTPDPADASLAGLPLQIRLLAIRDPNDPAYTWQQGDPYTFDYAKFAVFDNVTLDVAAGAVVPEPGTLALAALGLLGLGWFGRRRRRRAA